MAEHAGCIHTLTAYAFVSVFEDLTGLLAGHMLPKQSTDLASRGGFLGDLIVLLLLYIHQFSQSSQWVFVGLLDFAVIFICEHALVADLDLL